VKKYPNLSITKTLGPLVLEAGYFSGENPCVLSGSVLEYLGDVAPGYLVIFRVAVMRIVLAVSLDFDWRRNRARKEVAE